jgi:predicted P-loop ATPase
MPIKKLLNKYFMSAKLQNNTDNQSVKGKKIKGKTAELDAGKNQGEAPKLETPKRQGKAPKVETEKNEGQASKGENPKSQDKGQAPNPESKKPIITLLEEYIFKKYDLRINIVSNELEGKLKGDKEYGLFSEDNLTYDLFVANFNRFTTQLAVLISTKVEKYDPLKEYFENLPRWDNSQPDYIQKLSEFVVIEDKVWWQSMFKKHLVRMVAQAILKIPFNKQCLTLVGKQNDGKTSFLEFLVPPQLSRYYRKGFDFGGNKDGKISLCQNFVINLDELATFEKKDLNNEFKTILTESTVKFRPLFAKNETTNYRRANFVASTNQYEFLTDETGNVRWLPFVVKDIVHDYGKGKGYQANVDIDLVWSQAYHLLMSGEFDCIMNKSEIEMQEKINQNFMRLSTEMEVIQKHFVSSNKDDPNSMFVTATEIQEKLLTKTSLRLNSVQIGKALKILQFQYTGEYNTFCSYTKKGYRIKEI